MFTYFYNFIKIEFYFLHVDTRKRERKKEREKEREICISASVLTYIFTTFPCACD